MPPKLPPCKICNKKEVGKYRCPVCHIDYCSVPCFKTHKTSACSSTTSYTPQILPSHPVISDEPLKSSTSERPKKRLRELNWPDEPDEGLWGNPLHRDDLKPLRGFEYEAIATSTSLRSLLASPSLIQTLTRITSLPRETKEPSLRLLLGLPPDSAPTVYRPSTSEKYQTSSQGISSSTNDRRSSGGNHNSRGGRGSGRGGSSRGGSKGGGRGGNEYEGRGLLESTAEERKGLSEFVEVVMREFESVRKAKGEFGICIMLLNDVNAGKLALLGSEIDHYLSDSSNSTDSTWTEEGSLESAGILCWTVQDSKLVRWTEALFSGDFRQEGSYLLLQTVAPSESQQSVLTRTIYTWFGLDSSTKVAEFISYKALELSEFLGSHLHTQRHVQSHESSSFLALFYPYFLVSLDGLDSVHISPSSRVSVRVTTPRLWQISLPLSDKGSRKQLKVQEVPAVTSSLTRNNVYILDRGVNLEIWYGKAAHPLEKEKAHEIAEFWVDSRGGKTTLTSFDDGSREDDTFFIDLGISSADLPIHFPPYSPASTPAISSSQAYSLLDFNSSSDSSSPTKFNQKLLIPQASYLIITIARSAYYIWVGSAVSVVESRKLMSTGQKILGGLVERGRASAGRVLIKINQNNEGEVFWNAISGR